MNYIYLVTNKINGKQYIGQTIRTIEERWKGHISTSKHQKDNNYFHNAIQKYGESSFEISLLEEVEDASLLDKKSNIIFLNIIPTFRMVIILQLVAVEFSVITIIE